MDNLGTKESQQASIMLSVLLQSTETLLSNGGDDRQSAIVGSSEKLNKYHSNTLPRGDVIRRGSCTCSTLNVSEYLVADKSRLDLLTSILPLDSDVLRENEFDKYFQDLLHRIKALLSSPSEVVVFPSGSDAEYMSVLLALFQSKLLVGSNSSVDVKVFNNVVASGEVGSGTYMAATGQHFSTVTPSGDASTPGSFLTGISEGIIEGAAFPPRSDSGDVHLREDDIMDAIHRQMSSSTTSMSVIHLVLGSKTGLVYPRWEKIQTLQTMYQKRLLVVVDACQLRCEFSQLSKFIDAGCVVMITGSKYFCGPPFSGAVLLPPAAVQVIEQYLDPSNGDTSLLPAGITAYLSYHQVGSSMANFRKRLKELGPNPLNVGLSLRWSVALHTMQAHSKLTSEQISHCTNSWIQSMQSLLSQHTDHLTELTSDQQSGADKVKGIISVLLSVSDARHSTRRHLTLEECRVFHRLMTVDLSPTASTSSASDLLLAQQLAVVATPSEGIALATRAMLGQPVCLSSASGLSVVRLALGADITLRISQGDLFGVMSEDQKVVLKMVALLKYWNKINSHVAASNTAVKGTVSTVSSVDAALSLRMRDIDSALHVEEVDAIPRSQASLSQTESICTALQTHFTASSGDALPNVSVLYDLAAFDRNIALANTAFSRLNPLYTTRHCFATKSCPLTYVLHYAVHHRGTGLECASLCEVKQALRVGCTPLHVIFDSPCKSESEILFALSQHVTLNANSYAELAKIKRCMTRLDAEGRSSKSVIGLRVNPMVGGGANAALSTATASSKFGIPLLSRETNEDTPDSVEVIDYTEQIVQAYLDHPFLTAIMCHVGSQGMPLRLMSLGAKRILDLADLVDLRCGSVRIKMVDIGGGISANYGSDDVSPTFEEYVSDLLTVCPALRRPFESGSSASSTSQRLLLTEFGKGLIAKCGFITSRIEDVLHSPAIGATDAAVPAVVAIGHAGADLMLRTAYCPSKFPHRVILLDQNKRLVTDGERESGTVTIAGPLCFSGDIVAQSLPNYPIPTAGDICVVLDAGANTLSLFSRHCSRMSPKVYAFRHNRMAVISEGETENDVLTFWD